MWEPRRSPRAVDVVDAFSVGDGRCDQNLPGDAIHFHGLLYDELTLLLETLGWAPGPASGSCPRARRTWNASAADAGGGRLDGDV